MPPGRNQGEMDPDDDPPVDGTPTPQELLHVLETNPRYLGPGWLHETLVYLAGIHRREDP